MIRAARPPRARRLLAGAFVSLLTASPFVSAVRAEEAYITAQLANELAVVDLAAGQVSARIPIDGAPAGIALAPDRRRAYVTRPEAGAVAIVNLAARSVTASVALPGGPLGITVNPRTGAIYVADWYAARVFVLEPTPDGARLLDEIAVGRSPSGLAVTADGATLLVANREADTVSLIELASKKQTTLSVGHHPFGLTLAPDGARAYCANVLSNDVSVIDVANQREVGRIKVGERPYVVALTDRRGFVTNQYANSVTVFDLDTLTPIRDIDVDDHPEGIAVTRDGRTVVVSNWGDNTLSMIDVATLQVRSKIATPDGPRAFGEFIQ